MPILRSAATIALETATITIISAMIFVCNLGNMRILRSVTFWHKSTVYLLMNLAVSDICVATFTTSAIFSCITGTYVSPFACKIQAFLGGTSVTVSLITLMLISVDRYIIIAHPLRHRSLMSNKAIAFMTVLSWTVPVLLYLWVFWEDILGTQYNPHSFLCSADLTKHAPFVIVLVAVIFLPANVTIIYCYGTIFCIANRHSSNIQSQQAKLNLNKTNPKRNCKAAGMFIVVFGMFNVCWVPYVILVIYRVSHPMEQGPHWVNFIIPWMAMSNSFVNIFIYFILNAQYRTAVKRLFRCHGRTHSPPEGYTMESNF